MASPPRFYRSMVIAKRSPSWGNLKNLFFILPPQLTHGHTKKIREAFQAFAGWDSLSPLVSGNRVF